LRVTEGIADARRNPERFAGGEIIHWLVAASYDRTSREFAYTVEHLTKLFGAKVRASSRVDPGFIEIDIGPVKTVVKTKSTSDEQSLVMEAPYSIAICEAAQITYSAYLRLQRRAAEFRAPILMSGTLEGDIGWFVDLLKRGQSPAVWKAEDFRSWIVPSHTNHFIYPLGENDPEILRLKEVLSEDEFNRVHMGIPTPPRGRVHEMFTMDTHVQEVEYLEGEPVWLTMDPGIADVPGKAYAIECCQVVDGRVRIFDEIYVNNIFEEDIINSILLTPASPHWRDMPYWWSKSAVFGCIDRAGATRAGAHEASVEVWRKLTGINLRYTPKTIPIRDQIRAFNRFLHVDPITKQPGLVIDVKCKGIQSELGGCENPIYPGFQDTSYRWNVLADGTVIGESPRDRYNDAVKAVTYLIVLLFGYATGTKTSNIGHVKRHRRR